MVFDFSTKILESEKVEKNHFHKVENNQTKHGNLEIDRKKIAQIDSI